MELIVISESKLKIMLTAPDMAKYELETTRMDCADAHTREAFRHIFDDARAEIGFDTEGERLFIQLYTSKEGGCEIFVTKLGDNLAAPPAEEIFDADEAESPSVLAVAPHVMSEGERALLRRVYESGEEASDVETASTERRLTTVGTRTVAILFASTEDVLTVCRRLLREGYRGRSTAYIEDIGGETRWYLLLDVPDVSLHRLPRRFAYLAEYGRETEVAGLSLYLSEYGKLICEEDAVEVLGRL